MQLHGGTKAPGGNHRKNHRKNHRERHRRKHRAEAGNSPGGSRSPMFHRVAPAVVPILAMVTMLTMLTMLTMAVALTAFPARTAWSAPNFFEKRKIELQALEAFKEIIGRWREEVYFELYDSGMEESQGRISRQDFAQRMVELSWGPQGELNPKFLHLRYHFRTMVYVKARVSYRHKFDQTRSFSKDQTMVMVWEKGQWRIDLIELIRSPYSGV